MHSYPNVCIEIIALWFGTGDFDETARIVASAGYDVDCNAAQSLGMLGVVNTDSGIPERWTEPLGGRVETYCRGIPYISFDDLTELVVAAVRACGA